MKKANLSLIGAAVGAFTVLATIQPASALIAATGTINLNPSGNTTVDTGNIAAGTSSKTDPDYTVNTVDGTFSTTIKPGDLADLELNKIQVPLPANGTDKDIDDFTLTINAVQFKFTTGHTDSIIATNTAAPPSGTAGFINSEYHGSLVNGGGVFETGTLVNMAETCTQPVISGTAGPITCVNAVISVASVPEPASLALLGSALVGFGVIRRRRKTV